MKKVLITLLSASAVCSAQSLYDLAPDIRGLAPSIEVKRLATVNVGYDDNTSPIGGSGSATIGAGISLTGGRVLKRSDFTVGLDYGANYYFDDPSNVATDTSRLSHDLNLSAAYGRRINKKLTLSTSANVSYGLEPVYSYGIANDRTINEVFSWTSDVSFGYTVNRNFGIYSGVTFSGISFDNEDNADGDRITYTPYIQGRYRLNNFNYLTGSYRYSFSENIAFNNAESHIVTLGIESKLNRSTSITARVGAQFRDVDQGDSYVSPYAEFGVRHRFNEKFYLNGFLKYSISDYSTDFGNQYYERNNDFRVSIDSSYKLRPNLTLHAGLDYINNDYSDGSTIVDEFNGTTLVVPADTSLTDFSSDIFHLKAGAT
ncbi:hypothetical protein OAB00_04245, partial [Akkermansiaceae bacterium]|nr:hypothetical protein [Akkermansiaceae bacterium]